MSSRTSAGCSRTAASIPARPSSAPEPPAVQLDELLADRQPEPRAARAARDRVVELLERLEQARQVLLPDADAAVGHPHVDGLPLGHDTDHDAPLRRELDR